MCVCLRSPWLNSGQDRMRRLVAETSIRAPQTLTPSRDQWWWSRWKHKVTLTMTVSLTETMWVDHVLSSVAVYWWFCTSEDQLNTEWPAVVITDSTPSLLVEWPMMAVRHYGLIVFTHYTYTSHSVFQCCGNKVLALITFHVSQQ